MACYKQLHQAKSSQLLHWLCFSIITISCILVVYLLQGWACPNNFLLLLLGHICYSVIFSASNKTSAREKSWRHDPGVARHATRHMFACVTHMSIQHQSYPSQRYSICLTGYHTLCRSFPIFPYSPQKHTPNFWFPWTPSHASYFRKSRS
jgi:hypothetical protein